MLSIICMKGLFIPLVSFFILMFFSNKLSRRLTGLIASSATLLSFICFFTLLIIYLSYSLTSQTFFLYSWLPIAGINVDFSLHLDPLSLLMTLIITGIGYLIHVYSVGYMDHDEDYVRFFALLNFFIFSMLLLVLAENLLLLFVGWEFVGLASYLLIGFWYERPSAAAAAKKAFIMNRIGDLGLLLGILMAFYYFGSGDIQLISQQASEKFALGAPILTLMTLLFFFGATGKSAQLPLQTWLPDAMEGPTPVSALIHAATMVTAGIYLVVRMHSVFILSPMTLHVIGIVGGATAIYAALCATAQTDLKRVLAYSTISQLGLMFLACGVGAFYAAMFHLTTHAFVKALLFLSAGNVVHMTHGETLLDQMGGLKEKLPKTNWMFLIGVLSMSGLPPLAAFFSKELILEQEFIEGYYFLYFIGIVTSSLTAFYLMRAYCLVFLGKQNPLNSSVSEAPNVMLIPLSILTLFSVIGGIFGFACKEPALLESFLGEIGITLAEIDHTSCFFLSFETWIAIAGSLIGIGLSFYIYARYLGKLPPNIAIFNKAFYINEVYRVLFTTPLSWFAKFINCFLEKKVFNQSINVLVYGTGEISLFLKTIQSGQIRSYVAWLVIGSALSMMYLVL